MRSTGRPPRPLTTEEQKQIVILWRKGHGVKFISEVLHRGQKTIREGVRLLESVGILTVKTVNSRRRNPLGNKTVRMWWSKKRDYCPKWHRMTKTNTIQKSDGTRACRKCINTYQKMYQKIARSKFLSSDC